MTLNTHRVITAVTKGSPKSKANFVTLVTSSSLAMLGMEKQPKSFDAWFVFQWTSWSGIVFMTGYTSWYVLNKLFSTPWFTDGHFSSRYFESQMASNVLLLGHVVTAYPCLVLGPWLFLPRFRNKHLKWHRVMGIVYVYTIVLSSAMGFVLATRNEFGPWARGGFMSLAVVWFTTTIIGYRKVFERDIYSHRRWMIRSYAISMAVITIRFLDVPDGWTREQWFPVLTWACWIPNLTLSEIYIRISDDKGRFRFRGLIKNALNLSPSPQAVKNS